MSDITKELNQVRNERFFKDLQEVYNKLESIVKDEYDTSLEQFLHDYYTLKKELNK